MAIQNIRKSFAIGNQDLAKTCATGDAIQLVHGNTSGSDGESVDMSKVNCAVRDGVWLSEISSDSNLAIPVHTFVPVLKGIENRSPRGVFLRQVLDPTKHRLGGKRKKIAI